MARPVVSAPAEELYEALVPAFTEGDEDRDWPSLKLANVLTGPLVALHTYVSDQDDGTPGWVIVFDPDNAPAEVLPFLAQLDGAILRPDMDEAERRAAIKTPEGFGRGRPASILRVAARHLTGSKTVLYDERSDGTVGVDKPWQMRIRTLASETPDPALTEAEIRADGKPIGIVLTYEAITTWDWGDLIAAEATWADVQTDFPDWLTTRTQLP